MGQLPEIRGNSEAVAVLSEVVHDRRDRQRVIDAARGHVGGLGPRGGPILSDTQVSWSRVSTPAAPLRNTLGDGFKASRSNVRARSHSSEPSPKNDDKQHHTAGTSAFDLVDFSRSATNHAGPRGRPTPKHLAHRRGRDGAADTYRGALLEKPVEDSAFTGLVGSHISQSQPVSPAPSVHRRGRDGAADTYRGAFLEKPVEDSAFAGLVGSHISQSQPVSPAPSVHRRGRDGAADIYRGAFLEKPVEDSAFAGLVGSHISQSQSVSLAPSVHRRGRDGAADIYRGALLEKPVEDSAFAGLVGSHISQSQPVSPAPSVSPMPALPPAPPATTSSRHSHFRRRSDNYKRRSQSLDKNTGRMSMGIINAENGSMGTMSVSASNFYQESRPSELAGEYRSVGHSPALPSRSQEAVIKEEVPALDLIRILEQTFLEQVGSLDESFQWFDYACTGKISRMNWDWGLKKLALPDELLAFLSHKPAKIFSTIARKGRIDLEAWQLFFNYQSDLSAIGHGPPRWNLVLRQTVDDTEAEAHKRRVKSINCAASPPVSPRERSIGPETSFNSHDEPREGSQRGSLSETLSETLRAARDDSGDDSRNVSSRGATGHMRNPKRHKSALLSCPPAVSPSSSSSVLPNLAELAQQNPKNLAVATDLQVAEAEQLQDEIEKLNLKGVQALAYILASKFGSLDKAFKWLDYNSRGNFARVQWETGVTVLHIDLKQVTGIPANKFFSTMDSKNKGSVSKKKWDRFFEDFLDAEFDKILEDVASKQSLSQRAQHKLTEIWKRPRHRRRHKTKDRAVSSEHATEVERERPTMIATHQKETSTSSSAKPKARERTSLSPRPGTTENTSAATARPRSRQKDALRDSLRDLGGTSREASPSPRTMGRSTVQSLDQADPLASVERQPKTNKLVLDAFEPADFREQILEQLRSLGPDDSKDFSGLKRTERKVVEEVARELGFWCGQTLQSGQLRVINEGEEAARIRAKLAALKPGCHTSFDFSSSKWCNYNRQVADGMGLSVLPSDSTTDSEGKLEVWNLNGSVKEFADAIRQQLGQLAAGDILKLPSALSAVQTQVVEEIAADMGLFCRSFADGLQVGNLEEFRDRVRRDLSDLEAGKSCTYSQGVDGISELHVSIIRTVAEDMEVVDPHQYTFSRDRLTMQESRSQGLVEMTFTKPLLEDSKAAAENPCLDRDGIKERVAEVFELYATGRQNREMVFLRKPDLQRYAQDARRANRDHHHHHRIDMLDVMPELEHMYDEILELQIDMGSKVKNGLALEFFQAFLSKSSHLFGWSLISMLFALLEMARQSP